MKLTDALRGEHGVFYAQFGHLEENVPKSQDVAEVRGQAALLAACLITHATLEDEVLFAALEPAIGKMGPLAVMRMEHEQIDGALASAREATDLGQAKELVLKALSVAREHFTKEERVLFSMAEQALGEEQLSELCARWAERRGVFV